MIDSNLVENETSPEAIAFAKALEKYKASSGRMFPTCSEVLEVLQNMGYEKTPDKTELTEQPPA